MKLPLSWLKEFINYSISEDALAKKLTDVGFEVEEIIKPTASSTLGTTFVLNVTPNRGDALSIIGLAREVSAILDKPYKNSSQNKKYKISKKYSSGEAGDRLSQVSVKLEQSKDCPRYMMAVFKNVKVASSPQWLQNRLEQIGIRPINNVVDMTNYILMAYGQPLHAFDRKKLQESEVVIRSAKKEEKITTLDGKIHELLPHDLVIADRKGPVALAGIMGGAGSEISDTTTEVALECAWFEPGTVRKTARRLGIQTDSSYRFERRVDYDVEKALFEAILLMKTFTGAELAGNILDIYPKPFLPKKITFRPARVEEVIGGTWKTSEIKRIIQNLGFEVKQTKKDAWTVTVPSWRGDVQREEDLFEEVVRSAGLNRVPVTFPNMTAAPIHSATPLHQLISAERRIKDLLCDLEFHEAIHFSFLSPDEILLVDPTLEDQLIKIANPLGHEFSIMRPTLIPSLLKTLQHHHRHKMPRVRLFELRNRFLKIRDGFVERKALSGVISGGKAQDIWSDHQPHTDFFELKGIIEKIMKVGGKGVSFEKPKQPVVFLHPGKQLQVMAGDEDLGVFGEIHPDLALKMDLKGSVYLFELDWTGLMQLPPPSKSFKKYSDQPVVARDLALLMDSNQPAGDLIPLLKSQDEAIQGVKIFDVYEGEKLPSGKKSVAYSLELSLNDRTMTDENINQVMQKLINYLKSSFGIEIR